MRREPRVVIAGSLYLIGEALELLGADAATGERALNEWQTDVSRGSSGTSLVAELT
jgi:hypothetical protein